MLERLVVPSPAQVRAGPTLKSLYSRRLRQRQEGHTVAEIVYHLRALLSIFFLDLRRESNGSYSSRLEVNEAAPMPGERE